MNLKSFLKKFFLGGEVLEKVVSSINGEILVTEDLLGGKEMKVGGVSQSGGLVEKLWDKGLEEVPRRKGTWVKKVLVLGLGGGTVAKLIQEDFPDCMMTGIEIDPKVIELGRKYFGLGEIPNLKVVIGNAIDLINEPSFLIHHSNFDLIIVDLYLGQEFPQEAEGDEFLEGLKKIMAKDGLGIFNRLYFNKEHQSATAQFVAKVKKHFPCLKTREVAYNWLLLASL